jgi:DNA-binding CsgD family transcriptional regulator
MATTRTTESADAPTLLTGIGREPLTPRQLELLCRIRRGAPPDEARRSG